MKHFDEHTLELYVLGSEAVASEQESIRKHLEECAGCRSYVEQMKGIYQNADELMDDAKGVGEFTTNKIVRKHSTVVQYNDLFTKPVLFQAKTRVQKVARFVRSYPVQSGVGMLGLAAGLAFLITSMVKSPPKDINPVDYWYDSSTNLLQIVNSKNEEIASFLLTDNSRPDRSKTQLSDLNGDGLNEIITTLAFPEDKSGNVGYLRICDAHGQLLDKKQFNVPFKYLDRIYGSLFNPTNVIVTSSEHNKKEMFVTVLNVGRSPSFIARLDNKASEIGRFWHFGNFYSQCMVDLSNNGGQQLILMGENDFQDDADREFPVIVVVDPIKIVGDKKSTACPGYEWTYSDAEIYYIRLPIPDVDAASKRIPAVRGGHFVSPELLDFLCVTGENENAGFDYFFNRKMELVDVKATDMAKVFRRKLVDQGKLRGSIDETYLDNLKNGVRYWDGKEWRKEVVKVDPSL